MQEKKMETSENPAQNLAMGALKQMSSEERIVFGLYFYENLSVNEISVILDKQKTRIEEILDKVFDQILQSVPADSTLDSAIINILGA